MEGQTLPVLGSECPTLTPSSSRTVLGHFLGIPFRWFFSGPDTKRRRRRPSCHGHPDVDPVRPTTAGARGHTPGPVRSRQEEVVEPVALGSVSVGRGPRHSSRRDRSRVPSTSTSWQQVPVGRKGPVGLPRPLSRVGQRGVRGRGLGGRGFWGRDEFLSPLSPSAPVRLWDQSRDTDPVLPTPVGATHRVRGIWRRTG